MLQLVYVSTARAGLGAGDFEGLMSQARARNRGDGITSLLIYDGQRFLQVLEGPEQHVERCFARLALDPRHSALDIVALRSILIPAFGTWDLQFHRIDQGYNASALGLIEALVKRMPDPAIGDFVLDFCKLGRRAA
jgi:hypothetical protein